MNKLNQHLHEIYTLALARLKERETTLCCVSIDHVADGEFREFAIALFHEYHKPEEISNDDTAFWPIEDRQTRFDAMENMIHLCTLNTFSLPQ